MPRTPKLHTSRYHDAFLFLLGYPISSVGLKIIPLKLSSGVGRRNDSCPHKWLLLGALNGHFLTFTLQIFCFFRHMWRCGDHLPTSAHNNSFFHKKNKKINIYIYLFDIEIVLIEKKSLLHQFS